MTSARATLDAAMTENQWLDQVRTYATRQGWLVYHTHDSRRSEAGFPDLVLVREQVLFIELKTEHGSLRPDQRVWQERLTEARASCYLWRPHDWPTVMRILK